MRTTLSLESDVAALIEQELSEKKTTLKAVINERLRRGFAIEVGTPKYDLPTPMNLGNPLIQNFDNIGDILELIENDPR